MASSSNAYAGNISLPRPKPAVPPAMAGMVNPRPVAGPTNPAARTATGAARPGLLPNGLPRQRLPAVSRNPNTQQSALMQPAAANALLWGKQDLRISPKTDIIAGPTPNEKAGNAMALGAAYGPQTAMAQQGVNADKFLLNDVLYPGSNPALRGTIDAATRPITQALTEQELPQIRSGAAASGQYGSSRQGIAEGLAAGRASQAIGDTSAKIANANYQAGLDAMTKALGLHPATMESTLMPAQTVSGVGDVQRSWNQDAANEALARKFYNESVPLMKATNLENLAGAVPGATTGQPQVNPLMQLLGGASTGATLGSAVGGPMGALAGGGIGALLSAFSK